MVLGELWPIVLFKSFLLRKGHCATGWPKQKHYESRGMTGHLGSTVPGPDREDMSQNLGKKRPKQRLRAMEGRAWGTAAPPTSSCSRVVRRQVTSKGEHRPLPRRSIDRPQRVVPEHRLAPRMHSWTQTAHKDRVLNPQNVPKSGFQNPQTEPKGVFLNPQTVPKGGLLNP